MRIAFIIEKIEKKILQETSAKIPTDKNETLNKISVFTRVHFIILHNNIIIIIHIHIHIIQNNNNTYIT